MPSTGCKNQFFGQQLVFCVAFDAFGSLNSDDGLPLYQRSHQRHIRDYLIGYLIALWCNSAAQVATSSANRELIKVMSYIVKITIGESVNSAEASPGQSLYRGLRRHASVTRKAP